MKLLTVLLELEGDNRGKRKAGQYPERNKTGFNMWRAPLGRQLLVWGPLCKIPKVKSLTMKHIYNKRVRPLRGRPLWGRPCS